jgi:hypothetical protein
VQKSTEDICRRSAGTSHPHNATPHTTEEGGALYQHPLFVRGASPLVDFCPMGLPTLAGAVLRCAALCFAFSRLPSEEHEEPGEGGREGTTEGAEVAACR